jgi:glyoxylase-like metal-dependent hydrolase (beta-lactamase superfamily II)
MGLPIRILFLPGHTCDSMGLLLEETGRLFCGDAAMNALIITRPSYHLDRRPRRVWPVLGQDARA